MNKALSFLLKTKKKGCYMVMLELKCISRTQRAIQRSDKLGHLKNK